MMKILWVIFIVWSIDSDSPLSKPFKDECIRVGGFTQVQKMSKNVSAIRCIKIKDENKEPKRIPNTYSVG